jgi:hypothetical protein
MRHEEEENHWHPSNRRHHGDRRRESHRHREGDNFNDFGSRWGEPDPRLNLRHQDWQEEHEYDRRNPREDWHPFEQHIEDQRHHQNHGYNDRRHGHQRFEEQQWRERDRHFNRNNQHADDRWQYDNNMPHPKQDEHHYQEDVQRRRRNRDHRDYRDY